MRIRRIKRIMADFIRFYSLNLLNPHSIKLSLLKCLVDDLLRLGLDAL